LGVKTLFVDAAACSEGLRAFQEESVIDGCATSWREVVRIFGFGVKTLLVNATACSEGHGAFLEESVINGGEEGMEPAERNISRGAALS
jgi:hypothetical protein